MKIADRPESSENLAVCAAASLRDKEAARCLVYETILIAPPQPCSPRFAKAARKPSSPRSSSQAADPYSDRAGAVARFMLIPGLSNMTEYGPTLWTREVRRGVVQPQNRSQPPASGANSWRNAKHTSRPHGFGQSRHETPQALPSADTVSFSVQRSKSKTFPRCRGDTSKNFLAGDYRLSAGSAVRFATGRGNLGGM